MRAIVQRTNRASKWARSFGYFRSKPSARSAWPGTYPFPMRSVASLPTPSAPSAAVVKLVAIEKKITVPPSRTSRSDEISVPGTLAQFTTRSNRPPGRLDPLQRLDAARGVERQRPVDDADGPQAGERLLRQVGRHHLARAGEGLLGLGADQRARLPGADDEDPGSGAGVPGHERRRPADVEGGERQRVGQVPREPRPEAGGEEDGGPAHVDALHLRVHRHELVDAERREREGDQRGDAVPHGDGVGRRVARPDLPDPADEHPARAGHRVVHLAPLPDDARHLRADAGRVAPHRVGDLLEARRVDVERVHVDGQLVVAERQVGIEPVGALGEHAGGGNARASVHRGPRWARD